MPVARTEGEGSGMAGGVSTAHVGLGRAACAGLVAAVQRWWCCLWHMKGLPVMPSSPRG